MPAAMVVLRWPLPQGAVTLRPTAPSTRHAPCALVCRRPAHCERRPQSQAVLRSGCLLESAPLTSAVYARACMCCAQLLRNPTPTTPASRPGPAHRSRWCCGTAVAPCEPWYGELQHSTCGHGHMRRLLHRLVAAPTATARCLLACNPQLPSAPPSASSCLVDRLCAVNHRRLRVDGWGASVQVKLPQRHAGSTR